ncbi:MAG: hypothetical protein ACRDAU_05520 [Clostridium sp.]
MSNLLIQYFKFTVKSKNMITCNIYAIPDIIKVMEDVLMTIFHNENPRLLKEQP